jgi:hypothetical protein
MHDSSYNAIYKKHMPPSFLHSSRETHTRYMEAIARHEKY